MQAHPRTASAANADQRLSQIIKLKQLEKPDAAYWQKFEQEFRSRQLTTFVQTQPLHTRLRRACQTIARKAAPSVTAAGAAALIFFAVSNTRYLSQNDSSEPQPSASTLAQISASEPQETFFTVNTTEAARSTNTPISNDTTYHSNVLSSQHDKAGGYRLNATPVTYSPSSAGQTIGAHILSKQTHY